MAKNKSARQLKKENEQIKSEMQKLQDEKQQLSLSLSKHEHQHIHNVTVSDLPTPEEFKSYPEEIQEVILMRIKADIENDKKLLVLEEKEQSIRDRESTGEIKLKTRGQIFAFSSLVFLGLLSVYFASIGALKIAAAIAGVTIVGSVTAFTGFGKKKTR